MPIAPKFGSTLYSKQFLKWYLLGGQAFVVRIWFNEGIYSPAFFGHFPDIDRFWTCRKFSFYAWVFKKFIGVLGKILKFNGKLWGKTCVFDDCKPIYRHFLRENWFLALSLIFGILEFFALGFFWPEAKKKADWYTITISLKKVFFHYFIHHLTQGMMTWPN